MQIDEPYIPPFIRRLMPSASEQDLLRATNNLRRYLSVMYRLFRELEVEQARADSHRPMLDDRFQSGGDNPPSQ
ncbi:MAG: hypothetical protein EPO55_20235 [Reyranella sp.]|uniref:hypothetical protein n=1 Tax=Reyranella sp. TaxID=1929291 RepID=UPI0012278544|nr:hypothetical protein [Reyranella sp.]TAJ36856.1 MAG: hypothetical protein EPO55_20235 [Reyranella sp.]